MESIRFDCMDGMDGMDDMDGMVWMVWMIWMIWMVWYGWMMDGWMDVWMVCDSVYLIYKH